MQEGSSSPFVVDLLTTLRAERFSPRSWWHFLVRSWNMSCTTAGANPRLTRSWLRLTIFMSGLALVILGSALVLEGSSNTLRLLPAFLFCIAWQQSDLFWHLGLNRHIQTGELAQTIGIANTLTALRGMCAAFLLSRLLGGLSTSSWLVLSVFLIGIVTDILDGLVARFTNTRSKLGQIMDCETDLCLYLSVIMILFQNGILPLWLCLVMLLRFCLPLVAGLTSYFLLARPVRFSSTMWGRYAGAAQCLYFLFLLAPSRLAFFTHLVNFYLLIVTVVLLMIAPIAQIVGNLWGLNRS